MERLRAICLALPEATEKVAWGEPTWRVKGRLFGQLDDHHHGADHLAVWLPAPLGEQEAMIFTDPARFFRPPYVGHRGWIGVRLDGRPDWAAVARLVEQAYRLVAPTRLRQEATVPCDGVWPKVAVVYRFRDSWPGITDPAPRKVGHDAARDRHGVQRPEARDG